MGALCWNLGEGNLDLLYGLLQKHTLFEAFFHTKLPNLLRLLRLLFIQINRDGMQFDLSKEYLQLYDKV